MGSSVSFRVLLFGVVFLLSGGGARAHDPFESTTLVRLGATTLELEVTMARSTALSAAKDGQPSPTFAPEDLDALRPLLLAGASGLFVLTQAGERLVPEAVSVSLNVEADVEWHVTYVRPLPGRLEIHALHVERLGHGYGSVLNFDFRPEPSPPVSLLMGADTRVQVNVPGASLIEGSGATLPPAAASVFGPFLRLGVVHILTGYDHLLFLLGLLVVCRHGDQTFGLITCFTLAHSLTLAVAALGVFSLPGRIVEPLIAASIVYVGIENLVRHEEPKGRWLLAFIFGLLHGFGFAGALRGAGLGTAEHGLIGPLFAFNLGVELGQLAIVAATLPLFIALRRDPVRLRFGQVIVSVLVAVAGAGWLAQRTVFS